METTSSISPPCSSPPPSTANLRLRRNVHFQARFSMPLIDLTLRRITSANPFQLRFNQHPKNPLSLSTQICPKIMADEPKKTDIQPTKAETTNLGKSKDEDGSEKTIAQHIPPPPEKPLPGDCCGSGCVRCVWDVYYEELDEYDRLYKAN
ncbi:hypothetical protein CASFOL_019497 [Castilleja foliolosa]|uniref:Oxidoreductase-like domain-containing protein n=1 Tax=Castilleja foliolosa TaxID=1961234 RepID=A0ABD3D4I0_9LAMI